MSRPVAGLACRIRIPVRQYQAVALITRERGGVVRLMHRDAALSLDVEAFDNVPAAAAYRDRLAGFLDLPTVLVAATACTEGAGECERPQERRIRPGRARRPRFLSRRRSGGAIAIHKVEGREIIARS